MMRRKPTGSEPKKSEQPPGTGDAPAPGAPEVPKVDTSTDWDEWMEKHDGRLPSRPDVADAEGKFG
jgi:hypothetical protein